MLRNGTSDWAVGRFCDDPPSLALSLAGRSVNTLSGDGPLGIDESKPFPGLFIMLPLVKDAGSEVRFKYGLGIDSLSLLAPPTAEAPSCPSDLSAPSFCIRV